MPSLCTNDKPCGKGEGRCSAVCQTAAAQLARRPRTEVPPAPLRVRGKSPGTEALEREFGPSLVGCACGQTTMSRAAAGANDWPVVRGVEHRYSFPCRPLDDAAFQRDMARKIREDEAKPIPPTSRIVGLAGAIAERAGREGDQALPVEGDGDVILELVAEIQARRAIGLKRYGRPLQRFNGRDVGRDLTDELLDAAIYARQADGEHKAVVEALIVLARQKRGDTVSLAEAAAALDLAEKLEKSRAR